MLDIDSFSSSEVTQNISFDSNLLDSSALPDSASKISFNTLAPQYKHVDSSGHDFKASLQLSGHEKTHLSAYPILAPRYGAESSQHFIPQSLIANKLLEHLEAKQADLDTQTDYSLGKGLCYGLSLLQLYYHLIGNASNHFEALKKIVIEEEIGNSEALDRLANDILYLHAAYNKGRQEEPVSALKFVASGKLAQNLHSSFNFSASFQSSDNELEEFLYKLLSCDTTKARSLLVHTGSHSFTISFSREGLSVYNPDFGCVFWNSLNKEAVEGLVEYIYKSLGVQEKALSLCLNVLSCDELPETKALDAKDLIKPLSAKLNKESYNACSALYGACLSSYQELAALLIENEADVNALNPQGNSPLLAAVQTGNKDLVSLLIAAGADLNHQNEEGASALLLAKQWSYSEIVSLLELHGATLPEDYKPEEGKVFSTLLLSADLSLAAMPSSNHMGVDTNTGLRVSSEMDVAIQSADPLTFQRNLYGHPDGSAFYAGFHINHARVLSIFPATIKDTQGKYQIEEPGGYHISYNKKTGKPIDLWKAGVSNASSHGIDATSSFGQQYCKTENGKVTLYLKNGGVRYFERSKHLDTMLLKWEEKPNGNLVRYRYDDRGRPTWIGGYNAKKENVFGWIKIHYRKDMPKEYKRRVKDAPISYIQTSDGQIVKYDTEFIEKGRPGSRDYKLFLKGVRSKHKVDNAYEWDPQHKAFAKEINPSGGYYKHEFSGDLSVKKIKLSRDAKGNEGAICSFVYKNLPGNPKASCEVYDANGGKTVYHHTKEGRLGAVESYIKENGQYQKYRSKVFHYADEKSKYPGHLISTTFKDANDKAYFCQAFRYNDKGLPVSKTIYGNLSGRGESRFSIGDNGYPDTKGIESFKVSYCYYDDPNGRFNLLKEEVHQDGKRLRFNYKKGTNLPSAILLYDGKKLLQRTFHRYDDNAALVKTIVDDGKALSSKDTKGVHFREITLYKNRSKLPATGLPEEIVEQVWDPKTGKTKTLKKRELHYDKKGRVEQESIFDANGVKAYDLSFSYNAHGKVVSSTNALGEKTTYKYDSSDNLVKEQGPKRNHYASYDYDLNNRQVAEHENVRVAHEKRELDYKTRYYHNLMGLRTKEIDPLGSSRTYHYDSLGRLTHTLHPKLMVGNRLQSPKESFEYDLFDNLSKTTDTKGRETSYQYNVRGEKTHAYYPDGTKESWVYYSNGKLRSHTDKEGIETAYSYDGLGRVVLEKQLVLDKKVNRKRILRQQSWEYNSLQLTSHTDYLGNTTRHFYNAEGRESEVHYPGGKKECYIYDSLGRVERTLSYFGSDEKNYTAKVYVYDLLGRLTEERIEDSSEKVLQKESYSYDKDGLKSATIHYHKDEKETKSRVIYDGRKRPITIIDDKGNKSTIEYKEVPHPQIKGVKLLEVTMQDPKGIKKQVLFDEYHRKKSETFLKDDKVLSKRRFIYDILGNLRSEKHHVYYENGEERKSPYAIQRSYNETGQLTEITENPHNKKACKSTFYSYDKLGRLSEITKPDGRVIKHRYDLLGRLECLSSGKDFSTTYSYDKNDNVVKVVDKRAGEEFVTRRVYDEASRVSSERLGNGYSIGYAYDKLDRLTKLSLEDGSSVSYDYDALHLKQIKRLDKDNNESYVHEFATHDFDGKLLEAKAPGAIGSLEYNYTKNGEIKQLTSPSFSFELDYDKAGNITLVKQEDAVGEQSVAYDYNDLYQVVREKGSDYEHEYAYDSLGNRIEKDGHKNAHDANNALTRAHQEKRSYDKSGNLTHLVSKTDELSYGYDPLDRLTLLESKDKWQKRYAYDAFNRRLFEERYSWDSTSSKWVSEGREYFVYCDQKEIGSYRSKKALNSFRVIDPTKESEHGSAVLFELSGKTYVPLYDYRGSVSALCDPDTGKVEESYRYSAFGEEEIYNGSLEIVEHSSLLNPWRFASKRICLDSAYIYFGERYYDASQGIWITTDPNGFGDGPNLYAYVKNSPLRYADQYGLEAEDISDTDSAEGDRSSSDDKSGFWSSVKDGASYVFDKVSGGVISFFEAGIEHNTVTLGKAYDNAPELAKDLVWGFTDVIKELEEGTFSDKSLGEQAKSIGLGVLDRVALFGGASLLGRTTKSIISNLNIWRTIEVRSQIVHNRGSNGFSGHKGYQLRNAKQQPTRNNNTLINNRLFSRHAIDQMQNRGIPPSAVKDTLCNGVREIGKERGTTFNYSSRNNISVITNSENGQVITVTYGKVQ